MEAQDRVVGRTMAEQCGAHDEGAQQGGEQVNRQSRVESMIRGRNRVEGTVRAGNGMAGQGRVRHGRGSDRGKCSVGQGRAGQRQE